MRLAGHQRQPDCSWAESNRVVPQLQLPSTLAGPCRLTLLKQHLVAGIHPAGPAREWEELHSEAAALVDQYIHNDALAVEIVLLADRTFRRLSGNRGNMSLLGCSAVAVEAVPVVANLAEIVRSSQNDHEVQGQQSVLDRLVRPMFECEAY